VLKDSVNYLATHAVQQNLHVKGVTYVKMITKARKFVTYARSLFVVSIPRLKENKFAYHAKTLFETFKFILINIIFKKKYKIKLYPFLALFFQVYLNF
jgi:hypothetical protein